MAKNDFARGPLSIHIRNKKLPGSLSIVLDMVLVGGLEVLLGPVKYENGITHL